MIRPNVVCPECKNRGCKEYKAIDYSQEKVKGMPYKTGVKRSCPVCKNGWFVVKAGRKTTPTASKA